MKILKSKFEELFKRSKSQKGKTVSKSKEAEEIEINDKSTKQTNKTEEVSFSENKDEIEIKDDINNSRKKRRRSSASVE